MPTAQQRAEELLFGYERRRKPKYGYYLSAAGKVPEVMVKITNSIQKGTHQTSSHTAKHLDYISRHGKVELETKDGEVVTDSKERAKLIQSWKTQGLLEEVSGRKQHLNLVLSMPQGTPPDLVLKGARRFAQKLFNNHEWCLALHTDTQRPHVHVCVSMQGIDGKRLNPRKKDLFKWRVLFADLMNQQGISCTATRRMHRGIFQKRQRSTIGQIEKNQRISWVNYENIRLLKKAIQENKRPINEFLAKQLKTQTLMVKEYNILAKQLYQEGYKTQAKAISQLSKQLKEKTPRTKLQEMYDNIKEKNQYPPNYHLYSLLEEIKTGTIPLNEISHHANRLLSPQEYKQLHQQLDKEGLKKEAHAMNTEKTIADPLTR